MLDVKKLFTKVLDAIKADFVVEVGSNTYGNYRKWNSGIVEQWGYLTTGASSGNVQTNINFPISFKDTNYTVLLAASNNMNANTILIAENSYGSANRNRTVSNTTISVYKSGNAYAQGFNWFAIGYWK